MPTPLALPAPSNGPALPAKLAASPDASGGIDLAWTDDANNETGYVVERRGGSDADFRAIYTGGANIIDYQDTANLSPSTTYTYRVRATNGSGDSPNSNEASATTNVASGVAYALAVATSSSSIRSTGGKTQERRPTRSCGRELKRISRPRRRSPPSVPRPGRSPTTTIAALPRGKCTVTA